MSGYVGRLAPSPTGALHFGNVRTFMIAWLRARSQGGKVILRTEDLDHPKDKPGAAAQAIEDLRWLGFDWDEEYVQSERKAIYREALESLLHPHQAPGTSLQAPSTKHQAPDTRHQAPGTRHQAPGTRHQTPGTRHQAPGTNHQALIYPCVCSRKDVESAQSAPHAGEQLYYPGTCRGRFATWREAADHKLSQLASQSNNRTIEQFPAPLLAFSRSR